MPTIQKTRRIFEFIRRYQMSNGETPTMREIGRQFEMNSSASVHGHLKKLERKGWIKRSRKWRGIEIIEQRENEAA